MSDHQHSEAVKRGHLGIAATYVEHSWLPVNPTTLSRVQKAIAANGSGPGRAATVEFLKRDPSLLFFSLREAARFEKAIPANPFTLLRSASPERFSSMLTGGAGHFSKHSVAGMQPLQAARVKESLISAGAAGALAPVYRIDNETGYLCAMFRQLGPLLLAWNYPHVYRRAYSLLRGSERVEGILHKVLGFSPRTLSATLASHWRMPREIVAVISDAAGQTADPSSPASLRQDALREICRIGETLGRASCRAYYPSAEQDWEDAQRRIGAALGRRGWAALVRTLEENLSDFAAQSREMFKIAPQLSALRSEAERIGAALLERNPHLTECSEQARAMFFDFYDRFDGESGSEAAIDYFTRGLLPGLGLDRGCIYLIDSDAVTLNPRALIGQSTSADFQAVRASAHAGHAQGASPVSEALFARSPIGGTRGAGGELIGWMAGTIGESQIVGVLYVEAKGMRPEPNSPLFRAACRALGDALGVY